MRKNSHLVFLLHFIDAEIPQQLDLGTTLASCFVLRYMHLHFLHNVNIAYFHTFGIPEPNRHWLHTAVKVLFDS